MQTFQISSHIVISNILGYILVLTIVILTIVLHILKKSFLDEGRSPLPIGKGHILNVFFKFIVIIIIIIGNLETTLF